MTAPDEPLTVTVYQLDVALDRAVRYRRSLAPEHERNLKERISGRLLPQPQWRPNGYVAIGEVLDEVAGGLILAVEWHPVSDAVKVKRPPAERVRSEPSKPRYVDGNPWGIR